MKKRFLCSLIAVTQIFGTITFLNGYAKESDGVYVCYNMESAEGKPQYTGVGSYSFGYETDDADKGTVIVADAGASAPTGANNQFSMLLPLDESITDKVVISFDAKTSGGDGGYIQIAVEDSLKQSYLLGVLDSNTSRTWLFNNWTAKSPVAPVGENEWSRIDVILDLETEKAQLYKDGVLIDSGNKTSSYKTLADVSYVKLNCFVATEPVDGNYLTKQFKIDNITVSDLDGLASAKATAILGENGEVYIKPSSTIKDNGESPESAKLIKVGTSKEINAEVSMVNGSLCLIPEAELEVAAEYAIEFLGDTEFVNFLDMPINLETTIMTPVEETEVVLLDEDFSDADSLSGFEPTTGTGAVGTNRATMEFSDEEAMRIKPTEWRSGAQFTMPDSLPASYKLKISYRAKLEPSAGGQLGAYFIETGSALNTGETMGMAMNYNADVAGTIAYPNYADWWCGNKRLVLLDADEVDEETWYTYEYEYDVTGVSRPTVSYWVKDEDGNVLASLLGVTAAGKTFIYPEYIRFEYTRPTDKGGSALFDDIKISYAHTPNYVKSARIESVLGEEKILSGSPSNAMRGFKLEFAKAPENVDVVLTSGEEEIYVNPYLDDKTLKIGLDEFLENKEYTLTVDFGELKPYTAVFTPVVEEEPIIADFSIYRGDEKIQSIDELSASDTITVKATIYNSTGEDITGCLSYAVYDGLKLAGMNFEEAILSGSPEGVNIEKSFQGTLLGENPRIKAFLWNSIGELGFMTKPVELK